MIRDNVSLQTSINNSAFSSFLFSIFGWVLLHAWAVQIGAKPVLHVLIALIGIGPAIVSFRRYRLHWAAITIPLGLDQRRSKIAFNLSNVGWGLLLLAIGNFFGQLILVGFVTPLAIVSIGLTFVPWSKVPLCRNHFFASCALMGVGVAGTLFIGRSHAAHPFILPFASWVFWGSACVSLFRKS